MSKGLHESTRHVPYVECCFAAARMEPITPCTRSTLFENYGDCAVTSLFGTYAGSIFDDAFGIEEAVRQSEHH